MSNIGRIYFLEMYCVDDEWDEEKTPQAYVKIGFTTDVEKRIAALRTSSPFSIDLICEYPGTKADERALHTLLRPHRTNREWFKYDDEIDDLIYDLQDAEVLLQMEQGEDYEPSISELLAYKDAGQKMDQLIAEVGHRVIPHLFQQKEG